MAVTGNTQLGATKQDLIAALVQKELKYQAKLIGTVSDVSAFAVKGAKSISFPTAGSFTVENRATATAGTIQDLTFAKEQLDLNYRAYIGWLVDSVDEYQSNVDVQAEYVKRAATAHARNLDEQILSVLDASSGYQQAAGIDQTKILNARKWLLKNQAVLSDCTMVVNPDDEALLLAIPEFVRADAYGSANIPTGVIGRIYGLNVMVHTKPTLAKSFVFEKSAIGFGLQKAPQYDEQKDIRYGTGSMLAAIDQLYGFKALQLGNGLDSAGVALASGLSPLIAEIG
jgi:Phage capsid protein